MGPSSPQGRSHKQPPQTRYPRRHLHLQHCCQESLVRSGRCHLSQSVALLKCIPLVPDRRGGLTFIPGSPPIPSRNTSLVDSKLSRHNRASIEDSPEVQIRVLRSQAVLQRHGNVAKPHDYDDGRGWRHGYGLALYDGTRGLRYSASVLTWYSAQKNLDPEQLKEVQESQARMVKMQSSITSGDLSG